MGESVAMTRCPVLRSARRLMRRRCCLICVGSQRTLTSSLQRLLMPKYKPKWTVSYTILSVLAFLFLASSLMALVAVLGLILHLPHPSLLVLCAIGIGGAIALKSIRAHLGGRF